MKSKYYLLALEVAPLTVGGTYDELPLHCTLMHRFHVKMTPEALADAVRPLFEHTPPITLTAHERMPLGPKQVMVAEVVMTPELQALHVQLHQRLNELGVIYTAPEWVGDGYRAHVTEREHACLSVGACHISTAAYLIEVKVPGQDGRRLVRVRFPLGNET